MVCYMYILYNMTICSVYPIENYNRGMGGNSNFARPMLPTYRGCTVAYTALVCISVWIVSMVKLLKQLSSTNLTEIVLLSKVAIMQ